MQPTTWQETLLQDLWIHLASVACVGIGTFGWYSSGFQHDPTSIQLMFIIGGLAGLGLKIVNGSAALLRAAIVAQQVATTQGIQAPAAVVVVPAVAAGLPPAPPPAP